VSVQNAEPALGSDLLTMVLALGLGVLAATVPVVVSRRWGLNATRVAGFGVGYGVVCVGLWASVRLAAEGSLPVSGPTGEILLLVVAAALTLGFMAGVGTYFYWRAQLGTPLALLGLCTASILSAYLYLTVDGVGRYPLFPLPGQSVTGSDPLFLANAFVPVYLVVAVLLAGGEWGLRQALRSR